MQLLSISSKVWSSSNQKHLSWWAWEAKPRNGTIPGFLNEYLTKGMEPTSKRVALGIL